MTLQAFEAAAAGGFDFDQKVLARYRRSRTDAPFKVRRGMARIAGEYVDHSTAGEMPGDGEPYDVLRYWIATDAGSAGTEYTVMGDVICTHIDRFVAEFLSNHDRAMWCHRPDECHGRIGTLGIFEEHHPTMEDAYEHHDEQVKSLTPKLRTIAAFLRHELDPAGNVQEALDKWLAGYTADLAAMKIRHLSGFVTPISQTALRDIEAMQEPYATALRIALHGIAAALAGDAYPNP